MDALFALVPSPLVGPGCWTPVADELRRRGIGSAIPVLEDDGTGAAGPYWRQHADAVRRTLAAIAVEQPLIFIGHSGAGPLLPILRQSAPHRVLGYLFVDAGLPHPGKSRLDEIKMSGPEFAEKFERDLLAGGRFPNWTDDDLREIIPDDQARAELLAELRPRLLAFFTETLPDVPGWPDAPCGYVLFSEAYTATAEQARSAGWPVRAFDAGHFHMLVNPGAVAAALAEMAAGFQSESQ
jgi:pimeloyl-ACP methyl ester carboxylesterase